MHQRKTYGPFFQAHKLHSPGAFAPTFEFRRPQLSIDMTPARFIKLALAVYFHAVEPILFPMRLSQRETL